MKTTNNGLIFTSENCIGCNKCIKGCPVLGSNIAIRDDDCSHIIVDGSKCIHCGNCLKNCEHDARYFRDDMDALISALKNGESIDLMIAPSFFLSYEDNAGNLLGFLKSLGFKHIYDVSVGANICSWGYIKYANESGRNGLIASTCPAVVDYIEKYQPSLIDRLVPIKSPVSCLRTLLKKRNPDSNTKYAFLGPCVGKHDELSSYSDGEVNDFSITFASLDKFINDLGVDISTLNGECDAIDRPGLAAFFPVPGGLKNNLRLFLKEDAFIKQIEGPREVYPYFNFLASSGKDDADLPFLIDVLNCEGGCAEGTGTTKAKVNIDDLSLRLFKSKKDKQLSYPDSPFDPSLSPEERFSILDKQMFDEGIEYRDIVRTFNKEAAIHEEELTPELIEASFQKLHKYTDDERNINCSSCGYSSCHEMAVAIVHGYNSPRNCVHYMNAMLETDQRSLEDLLNQVYGGADAVQISKLDTTQIAAQISQAISELETAKMEILNKSQSKNMFFASMTHELRTPLNAILNMADLISESLPDGTDKENAKNIKEAGNTLLDTINELLDISKFESGKLEIVNQPYSIVQLIRDVNNIICFRASEKKLNFILNTDDSIPATLIGDSKRLKQVLLNLLGNAVKYTPEGSVTLNTAWNHDETNPIITFEIIDTGIGIRKEDIPFLFGAFNQVDVVKNHNIEGTGLGLSITKALVDEMKGTITVTSEYGKGSNFRADIPQEIASLTSISDSNAGREDSQTKVSMPMVKVLIVDDMSVNAQVASSFLDKYQLHYETAASGEDAINMCASKPYDLILMDYRMPVLNGIDAAKRIKEGDGPSKDAPIILMSAEDFSSFSAEETAPFAGHIDKPLDKYQIESELLKIIPKNKQNVIKKDTLPKKGIFTKAISGMDFDTYLLSACAMERFARNKSLTQIAAMSKYHRIAVQELNKKYLETNAEFLDTELEILRNL